MVLQDGIQIPDIAGLHLKGAREIAKTFGVKVDTVRQWHKSGAPIFFLGKKYQTNYAELWNWLKDRQAIENEEEKI